METEELDVTLDGKNYLFRLIPRKIKESGRRITFSMFMNQIDNYVYKVGKLETKIFAGKNLKDWEDAGTFTEEYTSSSIDDCGEKCLILKLKNMKIELIQYYRYDGSYQGRGIIKKRNHWYEKWEKTYINNTRIKEIIQI